MVVCPVRAPRCYLNKSFGPDRFVIEEGYCCDYEAGGLKCLKSMVEMGHYFFGHQQWGPNEAGPEDSGHNKTTPRSSGAVEDGEARTFPLV